MSEVDGLSAAPFLSHTRPVPCLALYCLLAGFDSDKGTGVDAPGGGQFSHLHCQVSLQYPSVPDAPLEVLVLVVLAANRLRDSKQWQGKVGKCVAIRLKGLLLQYL